MNYRKAISIDFNSHIKVISEAVNAGRVLPVQVYIAIEFWLYALFLNNKRKSVIRNPITSAPYKLNV